MLWAIRRTRGYPTIKAHDLSISSTKLVHHIASYCVLEDLRFEVHYGSLQQATVCKTKDPAEGMTVVVNELEQLATRLDVVVLD